MDATRQYKCSQHMQLVHLTNAEMVIPLLYMSSPFSSGLRTRAKMTKMARCGKDHTVFGVLREVKLLKYGLFSKHGLRQKTLHNCSKYGFIQW